MKAHDTPRRIRPYKAATHTTGAGRYAHDTPLLAHQDGLRTRQGLIRVCSPLTGCMPRPHCANTFGFIACVRLVRGAFDTPPEGLLTYHPHIPKAVTLVFYTPQK